MKKFINLTTFVILLCMLAAMACGCSGKKTEEETVAQSIAAESAEAQATAEAVAPSVATTDATSATTAADTTATTAAATTAPEAGSTKTITDEMALDAIQNRCVIQNPDFASLSGDHWVIISSTDSQVVVLFTSYTGSENRYYIDRATGDTYVTELVPGIIDEEQMTDEKFNVKDHLAVEIYG